MYMARTKQEIQSDIYANEKRLEDMRRDRDNEIQQHERTRPKEYDYRTNAMEAMAKDAAVTQIINAVRGAHNVQINRYVEELGCLRDELDDLDPIVRQRKQDEKIERERERNRREEQERKDAVQTRKVEEEKKKERDYAKKYDDLVKIKDDAFYYFNIRQGQDKNYYTVFESYAKQFYAFGDYKAAQAHGDQCLRKYEQYKKRSKRVPLLRPFRFIGLLSAIASLYVFFRAVSDSVERAERWSGEDWQFAIIIMILLAIPYLILFFSSHTSRILRIIFLALGIIGVLYLSDLMRSDFNATTVQSAVDAPVINALLGSSLIADVMLFAFTKD
jgi:hypothetical protein